MRLADKVAIVTGGGSGMGASEAALFAREGARVMVADVWDEGGESVVAEIRANGGEAHYVHTDVRKDDAWLALLSETISKFGTLDVLVNNAGLSSTSQGDPLGVEGWDAIMDVNSTGAFLGTRHAIPAMIEAGGGSIINISSIMAYVGSAGGHPAYSASKGALRSMTKATAVAYGPQGIRANSVHPGFMPSMRSGGEGSEAARDRAARITPLRRIGDPLDVAYGVLFLASDEVAFVTGAELVIDGGFISQ